MQKINLYQTAFQPARELLPMAHLLLALLGFALLLLGGAWFLNDLRAERARQVEALTIQEAVLAKRIQATTEQDGAFKLLQNGSIHEEQAAEAFLNLLEESRNRHGVGYSSYLRALSKAKVPGIWLTGITIRQGHGDIVLDGNTLEPELAISWMDGLLKHPPFVGRRFATVQMEKGKVLTAPLNFHLVSHRPQEQGS